jgi:type I restriction-modification system DNA methylase subunit
MSNEQFSEFTLKMTNNLTKEEKKTYGIFITPNSIISSLFAIVKCYLNNDLTQIKSVLEPSCGTCEMINYCDNIMSNIEIDGIELYDKIYNLIKDFKFKNNINFYNIDFIKFNTDKLYDLIIGNPPYFVCKKTVIPKEYEQYIHGRPNIFGIFIIHSLSLLKPGGILAFIVPNSFLNSLYYSKIRNYI